MNKNIEDRNRFYGTIGFERPKTSEKNQRSRNYSTGISFQLNNTISLIRPQTSRLPSSSFRNTKRRVQNLGDRLVSLYREIKQERVNYKEISLHINFIKQQLTISSIDTIEINLTQSIKQLDRSIQIKKRSDMLKFEVLQKTCNALKRNTKQLREKMLDVNSRLIVIQNMLGFYGIKDKLKY